MTSHYLARYAPLTKEQKKFNLVKYPRFSYIQSREFHGDVFSFAFP